MEAVADRSATVDNGIFPAFRILRRCDKYFDILQTGQVEAPRYLSTGQVAPSATQHRETIMDSSSTPQVVDPAMTGSVNEDRANETRARAVLEPTTSQLRVIALLAEGLSNKQIGYELGMTEPTVKAHISQSMIRLRLNNRVQLAVWFLRRERSETRTKLSN